MQTDPWDVLSRQDFWWSIQFIKQLKGRPISQVLGAKALIQNRRSHLSFASIPPAPKLSGLRDRFRFLWKSSEFNAQSVFSRAPAP